MKSIKSFVAGVVVGSVLFTGIGFASLQIDTYEVSFNPVKFFYNGKEVQTERENYFYNGSQYVPISLNYEGTIYVPARFLSETVGKEVTWEQETRSIWISDPELATGNPDEQNGAVNSGEGKSEMGEGEYDVNALIVSRLEQVPQEISTWVEEQRKAEFQGVKVLGDKTYVLIARGATGHAGYGIEVLDIKENDGKLLVEAKYTEPDPDMAYAMVISYPFVLLEIETDLAVDFLVHQSSSINHSSSDNQ